MPKLELALGELEKAWKLGGVPAPTLEEANQMLRELALEKLKATEVLIEIHEMGVPRSYGDFFRLTLALDVTITKDGKEDKRERVFSTLQSDGTDWKPVPELSF